MVRSIVYDSVTIKTTRFEKPAPLAGDTELLAGIRMGYDQASLPQPEIREGDSLLQLQEEFLKNTEGNSAVNPKLIRIIKDYTPGSETVTEFLLEVC